MSSVRRLMRKFVPDPWLSYYRFIKNDPSRKCNLPFVKKVAMWRKGFYANRYYYYKLRDNASKWYISDYFITLAHPMNGPYSSLIDNKLYLPIYLRNFPEHIPQYYFLLTSDDVIKLFDERSVLDKRDSASLNVLLDIIESKKCVGKLINGSGGEGVLIFQHRQQDFLVNNKPYTRKELKYLFDSMKKNIITEYIAQHEYSTNLNESTTNTVRFLTCWDFDTNTPFIASGFHRIGRSKMYGADNGALGGLITSIDIEKGKLGHIALIKDGYVEYVKTHPDTGKKVYGTEIPHFTKIVSTILKMCYELNFVPYIAWDIVVTEDSFKILELNSCTDVYGYQLFKPLLSDIRTLNFYKKILTKKTKRFFMN